MAHGITKADSMMSVRRVPWHRLGAVHDERPRTLTDALEAAGPTWSVATERLYRADGTPVDGHHATVREDTDRVARRRQRRLRRRAEPRLLRHRRQPARLRTRLRNRRLAVGRTAGVHHRRAARPHHRRRRRSAPVRRPVGVPHRHRRNPRHDHPVHAVCANTVRAALERARSVYLVRHVGDPTGQLHEARAVLGMTIDYYRQFAAFGDRLALAPMGERALRSVLACLYADDAALGGRALANRRHARESVMAIFRHADTVGNAPGSKWCAWNAIAELHDHHGRRRTAEGAWTRAVEDPSGVKARALALFEAP